ncbi:hypothetical protein QEN19_001743 [Hanseniaspora menglaensis]
MNASTSGIQNIQELSPKDVVEYKIQLLLNINSILLLVLQEVGQNGICMTKLHGNIQHLVSLTNPNVQPKPLDLKPIPSEGFAQNTQALVTGLNKLYLLLTKLIELYP